MANDSKQDTEDAALTCCGQTVSADGYCQYRPGHPRQITPELLDAATDAASREFTLRGKVRAVLQIALAERGVEWTVQS